MGPDFRTDEESVLTSAGFTIDNLIKFLNIHVRDAHCTILLSIFYHSLYAGQLHREREVKENTQNTERRLDKS